MQYSMARKHRSAQGESGDCSSGLQKKGASVVIASVSESIKRMLAWTLEDAGNTCLQVSSRSELMAVLESQSISVAIIDASFSEFGSPPGVSCARPPIVLLLENGQVPNETWKSCNVFNLVIKPFSAGQILSSVASAIEWGRRNSLKYPSI